MGPTTHIFQDQLTDVSALYHCLLAYAYQLRVNGIVSVSSNRVQKPVNVTALVIVNCDSPDTDG